MISPRFSLDVPTVLRRGLVAPWLVSLSDRLFSLVPSLLWEFSERVRTGELRWR